MICRYEKQITTKTIFKITRDYQFWPKQSNKNEVKMEKTDSNMEASGLQDPRHWVVKASDPWETRSKSTEP